MFLPYFNISSWVELAISLEATEVVDGLANHSNAEDEAQWTPVRVEISYAQLWHKLAQGHHQEEHVQEKLELVVENLNRENKYILWDDYDKELLLKKVIQQVPYM